MLGQQKYGSFIYIVCHSLIYYIYCMGKCLLP